MLQDISNKLADTVEVSPAEEELSRGELLEHYLTMVVEYLALAGKLTEKKADIEFLLSIVGSYEIAKEEGKLDEDVKPPSDIFDERLFPVLDGTEEVEVEVIDETEGE